MEAHVAWLPYKPYMEKVGVYWANFNEQTQKIYDNGENVSTKTFIAVLFMTRWHSIGRNLVVCCLVAKSCQTLYDLVDCSPPGLPVLHYLPKFAQTHIHWVGDAIQPSHPLLPPSPLPSNFPISKSFLMSHLFSSGDQNFGAPASAMVLLMSIQDWFPLGLTGLTTGCPVCSGCEGAPQGNNGPSTSASITLSWRLDTYAGRPFSKGI